MAPIFSSHFKSLGRTPPSIVFAIFCLALFGLITLFVELDLIATDYRVTHYSQVYLPPSFEFPMGTDFLGRDMLSRALHGVSIALIVGFLSAFIATVIGLLLGVIAGFWGGLWDEFIVWLYTTLDSIPSLLLILALSFVLGQGLEHLFLVLGLTSWVSLCRLIRSEVIKQRSLEYILTAQALGVGQIRQIYYYILPNILHIALIQFALIFVYAIKAEVILSFLGLGVEPGEPSWGVIINDAKSELTQGIWWGLFIATTLMFLLIFSVNLITDFMRKKLDPQYHSSH